MPPEVLLAVVVRVAAAGVAVGRAAAVAPPDPLLGPVQGAGAVAVAGVLEAALDVRARAVEVVPPAVAAVEVATAPVEVVAAEEAGVAVFVTRPPRVAVATVAAGATLQEGLADVAGRAVAGPDA